MPSSLAVAIDLGTTTIAVAAVDRQGRVVADASAPNPQSRWGADVLTRLDAIAEDPPLLDEMRRAVLTECNSLIKKASGSAPVSEITVAGNSVMEHIVLGVSPLGFLRPPYKPAFKESTRNSARSAGFAAQNNAPLFVFPLIGGFVGGDAVAAALSLGLPSEKAALAIDIGTNSEILVQAGGTTYAASAAAGPAFEAANISCGMTAQKGVIEEVGMTEDEVVLGVIGKGKPKGICGSGLVDTVAALITSGVVDATGRIKSRDEVHTNISNRIIEAPSGNSFILYRSASSTITLTQQDIRSLQNAKAAIRAGIEVLLKKTGLAASAIESVYIAGAFGAHLKPRSLAGIGLLDEGWAEIAESAGDAALDGARLVLGSEEKKKEAEEIAAKAKYVSLSGSAHFEREFISRLSF